jgi:hypothetical protein
MVTRGLRVAAIVTPILTFINHGSEIAQGQLGASFWLQTSLTFAVPFTVSVVSSVLTQREACASAARRPRTQ